MLVAYIFFINTVVLLSHVRACITENDHDLYHDDFAWCPIHCTKMVNRANKEGKYYADISEVNLTVPWHYDANGGHRGWQKYAFSPISHVWEDYRGCIFTYYPDVNWNTCTGNKSPGDIANYLPIPSKDTEAKCKEFAQDSKYLKWDGSRNWKASDDKCGCIKWHNPEVNLNDGSGWQRTPSDITSKVRFCLVDKWGSHHERDTPRSDTWYKNEDIHYAHSNDVQLLPIDDEPLPMDTTTIVFMFCVALIPMLICFAINIYFCGKYSKDQRPTKYADVCVESEDEK